MKIESLLLVKGRTYIVPRESPKHVQLSKEEKDDLYANVRQWLKHPLLTDPLELPLSPSMFMEMVDYLAPEIASGEVVVNYSYASESSFLDLLKDRERY